jgi:hypothetical protein
MENFISSLMQLLLTLDDQPVTVRRTTLYRAIRLLRDELRRARVAERNVNHDQQARTTELGVTVDVHLQTNSVQGWVEILANFTAEWPSLPTNAEVETVDLTMFTETGK